MLRFAEPKSISYWSVGNAAASWTPTAARSVTDDQGTYTDQDIALRPDVTYPYPPTVSLTRPWRAGYGFGNSRFAELLPQATPVARWASMPALQSSPGALSGHLPQRDVHQQYYLPLRPKTRHNMTHIDLSNCAHTSTRPHPTLLKRPDFTQLIEEIRSALKNYLQVSQAHISAAMDVFSVYIEMTQNIRHYALARGYDELAGSATVVVARDADGRYLVQAGNMVEKEDGEKLLARVDHLAAMSPAELKAAYKTQLRQPRPEDAVTGAGLGLIDIARKIKLHR